MRQFFQRHRLALFAVFTWTAIHLFISEIRSIWMDELYRYNQFQMDLLPALKNLFEEPSPFAPGEIILAFISKGLFSSVMSFELWARIPYVAWGAATVALGFTFHKRFLPWFLFFSVALTTFSAQARPYGSLIFAGALAFKLIIDRKPLTRSMQALVCFTVLFSHLYGICYIGLAFFFRRDWKKVAACALYTVFVLGLFVWFNKTNPTRWLQASFPGGFIGTLKQVLGILGNPHKASYILAPLFLVGSTTFFLKYKNLLGKILVFFAATVLGPIAATIIGKYHFLPRQVAGALVPYLWFCAVGLEYIFDRLKLHKPKALILGSALTVGVAVAPWLLSIGLGKPPYADQPLHRYKHIAQELSQLQNRNVLSLDAAGLEDFYARRFLGNPESVTTENSPSPDFHIKKTCWKTGLCLYEVLDSWLVYEGPARLENSQEFSRYINDPLLNFERIIHVFPQVALNTKIPLERSWWSWPLTTQANPN